MSTFFRGRHLITTQDFTNEEIEMMLDLAKELKIKFSYGEPTPYLLYKTLFLIFFDESTRTRNSMQAGIAQLGGTGIFLTPDKMQIAHGEVAKDTGIILSRFGDGIGIRFCKFGQGNKYLREMAAHSKAPIMNLQDDVYHPFQVLADLMTIQERFGKNLRGLKVGISWAYAESHLKPLSVPQSQILLFTRFGMDITLAYPEGFDLMPEIVEQAKKNAEKFGGSLKISHKMEDAFVDADVVIPKNWGGFFVSDNPDEIRAEQAKHKNWICTEDLMKLTKKHSIYMHALPADRGKEVVDSVIDGPHSVVYDEAENRLHTAKAVMTLLMGGRF
ncbi:ornithine carbamoyltransferase [Thermosipho ferrireducens]|uniref:Ornithine carbamoyltransferase n=1 Tax=Thermosipho ferrireducens TaxID=2571116 RepID=A0ABX7S7X3_9BACT|nr:ornithine carbamoyltransferase [Thermosipho ferrireducens]QTA37727.1 ornithine carbamoyltransferase [Thermosipho ferrireducens]